MNMKNDVVEVIRRGLQARGRGAQVSRMTGISQMTLSRISRGLTPNPGVRTVRAIEAALASLAKPAKSVRKNGRKGAVR